MMSDTDTEQIRTEGEWIRQGSRWRFVLTVSGSTGRDRVEDAHEDPAGADPGVYTSKDEEAESATITIVPEPVDGVDDPQEAGGQRRLHDEWE